MRKCHGLIGITLIALLLSANLALAETTTNPRNLIGISEVQDRIGVDINLKGAEEFRLDAEEVRRIIVNALNSAGVATVAPASGQPSVSASVTGETTGGGGAKFTVEIDVTLSILSPFAKDRSISVLLWHGSRSRQEIMRYDSVAQAFVKPTGPINERVYEVVRELSSQLQGDFKKASYWK